MGEMHGRALTPGTRIQPTLPETWDLTHSFFQPACSARLSCLAPTAAAERQHGQVRLEKGAAEAEAAVEAGVLVTFTRALLRWLLQAPPMLPAEGPCRKPAGNRMVSRERKKKPILSQTGAFISTLVHSFKGQLPHRESVCMFEVRRPFLGLWNWVREGLVPSSRGAPLPAPLHGPARFSYAGRPSGKGDVAKKHQTWPPLG